jgi:hypothetical protein
VVRHSGRRGRGGVAGRGDHDGHTVHALALRSQGKRRFGQSG